MQRGKNIPFIKLFTFFLVFISINASGQKNVPLVNSLDLIKQGLELADSGAYDKANALYEQVSRNDTNYAAALFEEAVSCVSSNKDSLALIICQKGLDLHGEYQPDFYKLMGGALIDMDKYDDAINIIHKALLRFPNVYLLHFTMGLAQYKAKNYDSAVASFERSLSLNTFHASSHYYLGKCCLEQGRIIPAMLSLQFCLVLEPLTTRSFAIVQVLEKVMENKYEFNKATKVPVSKYNDGIFSDIDLLVQSQAALNKGYKAKTKINYNVVKQCQLICEKISYTPNSNNFWMDTYATFFAELQQKDYFEPYAYYIMQSVNDGDLQKDIKKEKKKINEFTDWADKKIIAMRRIRNITINGKPTALTYYYYNNHLPQAIGLENAKGTQTGLWTVYHENDGTVAASGSFNEDGKRIGMWQWYYPDSTLKEHTNYINGKREGLSETWYENGAKKASYLFKNDSLNGEATLYNSSGIIKNHGIYKADKASGDFNFYYPNGKLHFVVNYGEKGIEGEQKEYYVTGKLKIFTTFVDDKKTGLLKEWWPTGKLEEEGEYKDDKVTGHWKFYYADGSLQRESNYSESKLLGAYTTYFRNGKKKEEASYDNDGKLDGADTQYDDDGIKYIQLDYKKDICQHFKYFDKSGKVFAEGAISGKKLPYQSFYADGVKYCEGDLLDNKREGVWKFYSRLGSPTLKENYSDGALEGTKIDYYLNGNIKDSVNYYNDEKEGHYMSFWENGTPKSEGWYIAGEQQGEWYFYNIRGGVSSHEFYVNGDVHGYSDFYNPNGRIKEEDHNLPDYFDKDWVYDSTGKNIMYKYISDKGNGHYVLPYPNGQTRIERTYVAGSTEGPQKVYYYDGKLWAEGDFQLDKKQGAYKTYYPNGNLESVYNYEQGDLSGPAELYYESGKLKERYGYLSDDWEGPFKEYYEKGNVHNEGYTEEGSIEGETKHYSPDSLLSLVIRYKDNIITGYSYEGKDGKLVPFVPIDKGKGEIKAFYANGNKSLECTYQNNSLQGKRTEYFSNGTISEEENYDFGNLTGGQKYYYPNGKLKAEENYYMGEKDGKSSYYNENAKLEREENWVLGLRQGTFSYYDNAGKLLKTVQYYNNDEVSEAKK
jgi:antitoxin component YwqK of YwqJK toxin-antitoxin module